MARSACPDSFRGFPTVSGLTSSFRRGLVLVVRPADMKSALQHFAWIVTLACVWCPDWAAAQNLVVNGGFDTSAAGWTATNVSIGGGYVSSKGNPGGYYELNSPPSSTTDPEISQVVNGLIPGVSYAVSGDYEKTIDWGGGFPTTFSFGVEMNGVFLYEASQSDFAWHHFSFAFVADSPIITLSISAQRNGTGVSYGIDNIMLQPSPSLAVRVVGTNVVVSWPTNALGFSLQSSTNLTAASWSNVTNTAAIVGTNYSVTLGARQQKQFFRLKK
jgi:hypothetical protein